MHNSTIITIDKFGIVQSVDKNCCKLFGYELDELQGHSINLIIPAPYKEQHDTYLDNYMTTKVPHIIGKSRIVEGQHKDKSTFPIKLSVLKIREGDDTVFIGLIDKMEHTSASITINTGGVVVSCNEKVDELFGFKANELIGQNVNLIMPSPYREKHNQYIQNYIAGAAPKAIGHTRTLIARHQDGTTFPVSLQVEQLAVGAIQLFRGKIEKADVIEVILTLEEDGKIAACNQNLPLFGYTDNEVIGQNISVLIPSINQNSDVTDSPRIINPGDGPEKKKRRITDFAWKTPGIQKKEVLHKDKSVSKATIEVHALSFVNKNEPASPDLRAHTFYSMRIKQDGSARSASSDNNYIGDYKVDKTVGQGSYGKVKLAYHKETNQKVAIKILIKSKMKPPELERTIRETDILKALIHPNIARLYEIIETEEHLNIVMEYAGRTLLSHVLERHGLGESDAKKFFLQLLSAIKYCHEKNIIHRDIKHQNILLDDNNECKLIDFGLSNFMERGKLRSTFCGTPAYAAPEMILGKRYVGPEVDIWSMGVVLYSMITGVFPFENVGDIIKGSYKDPKDTSPECCDILKKMLQVEASQRATLEQVCSHAWTLGKTLQFQNVTSNLTIISPSPVVKEIECTIVENSNTTASSQPAVIPSSVPPKPDSDTPFSSPSTNHTPNKIVTNGNNVVAVDMKN